MKFKTLLASAAMVTPRLATAHRQMIVEIDSIAIKTNFDLAYVHRRIPIMAATFIPPDHRGDVAEAMERLSQRIAGAGHLKNRDRNEVKRIIADSITTIMAQPEKMPPAANGHAQGDAPWKDTHPSLAAGHNPALGSDEAAHMAETEQAAYAS